MKNNLSTKVKSKKDFKKIYHPLRTYWLFGSEACYICRAHEQSNRDGKIDYVGVEEIASQIVDENFAIHMSTPQNKNYAMDLLYAYDGWRDYERIDEDLYKELEKYKIVGKNYE